MSEKLYSRWPEHHGQLLMVVTPNYRTEGVLIGVEPLAAATALSVASKSPWALLTDDGLLFVDPDDPTVKIYSRAGLIGESEDELHQGLGRRERELFLEHCEATIFAAQELARATIRLKTGSAPCPRRQLKE